MEDRRNLTILDILKLGLAKEKVSFAYLARAGKMTSSTPLKKTLNKLALEELKHVLMLMDLSEISPVNPLEEIDLTFSPYSSREAEETEEELLRACMSTELESISLYMDLVANAQAEENDDLLRLLQQLVEEEKEHKRILEDILAKRLKEI